MERKLWQWVFCLDCEKWLDNCDPVECGNGVEDCATAHEDDGHRFSWCGHDHEDMPCVDRLFKI